MDDFHIKTNHPPQKPYQPNLADSLRQINQFDKSESFGLQMSIPALVCGVIALVKSSNGVLDWTDITINMCLVAAGLFTGSLGMMSSYRRKSGWIALCVIAIIINLIAIALSANGFRWFLIFQSITTKV